MPFSIHKLSAIVPVYNGAKTIQPLVSEIIKEIGSKYVLEIILINDGSPSDNSAYVCAEIAKNESIVKFIDLSRNFGEHNAVIAGLNYCTGDCAIILDDDFQNPPQEILKLVAELEKGNDVVFSSYEKKEHHVLRNMGSQFNNYVASALIKKPLDLYLSSFKAINRFLIDEIIKYKGPYPYIDGLILRSTTRYASVLVDHDKREDGESGYTVTKLISLWLNMFTNFSVLPLRIATIIGFLFTFISFILIILITIEHISNPSLPIGWASIIISVFLLGGVQLFAIGMVGEYLGRLFLNSAGKPQFIVRSTMNCDKKTKKAEI